MGDHGICDFEWAVCTSIMRSSIPSSLRLRQCAFKRGGGISLDKKVVELRKEFDLQDKYSNDNEGKSNFSSQMQSEHFEL